MHLPAFCDQRAKKHACCLGAVFPQGRSTFELMGSVIVIRNSKKNRSLDAKGLPQEF